MFDNPVKKALMTRRLTIGSWIQIGHPGNAEIMAKAGFAWLAVDSEHGEVETGDFGNLFRSITNFGTIPMVRVRENDTLEIRRALDLGAMGVIVPMINTAEDARKAVASAKYPPQGVRGFAFHRGNNWGINFNDYVKVANENIAVIVMIESKDAVANIDAILSVDGVDGVFIGPYDMSGSYSIPGQTDSEIVKNACKQVAKACIRAEKSAGIHIVLPTTEAVKKAVDDGFTLLGLGTDTVFLADGAAKWMNFIKGFGIK